MGLSDPIVLPEQCKFLGAVLDVANVQDINSVVHLGQHKPEGKKVDAYIQGRYPNAKQEFWDIKNDNWDMNKEWGVKDKDLVASFRVAHYVKDKDHFLEQLKKCIDNNRITVFDFQLFQGNLEVYNDNNQRTPSINFDFRFIHDTKEEYKESNINGTHVTWKDFCDVIPHPNVIRVHTTRSIFYHYLAWIK